MIVIFELAFDVPEVFQQRVKPGGKRFAHVKRDRRRRCEKLARICYGIEGARFYCVNRGVAAAAEPRGKLPKCRSRLCSRDQKHVVIATFYVTFPHTWP